MQTAFFSSQRVQKHFKRSNKNIQFVAEEQFSILNSLVLDNDSLNDTHFILKMIT